MSIRDLPGPAGIKWSKGRCPTCGARKGETRAPSQASDVTPPVVTKAQLERWGDVLNEDPTDEQYGQVIRELFRAAGVPAFQH